MQTTHQGFELTVAILMDDLVSAKEISTALRKQHILAHHYQSLDEFWVACSIQLPDLTIVDVTKMSQGSVQFKNHPKVIDGTLKYAFFSKDTTKILLQSTLGLSPLAFLHMDSSLSLQVEGLINSRIQEMKTAKEIKELEARVSRLQTRSQRMLSERADAEEFRANFSFIRDFAADIENEGAKHDFANSLIAKLDNWEAITSFGIYELNQSGQKLISPEVSRKKYNPLPALWLGESNVQGIEPFAESMAAQVANDLFEDSLVVLKLHSGSANPDFLLFISYTEERMNTFPWDIMENMLSSSLRRLKLYQQLPQYSSQFIPMWEALDDMDKLGTTQADNETRIVSLSLIPLTEVAKKRSNNKFYWAAFFNNFFLQLSGRLQKSTKLSLFGPWHVTFFIPKENLETETVMLQNFIKNFSYWKFFEDNSQILSEEMLPILKFVPASSAHYLRIFEKEFVEMSMNEEAMPILGSQRASSKRLSI